MTIRRLKYLLLAFFIALALPTSILVYQAYGQLKWEAFHQHQLLARELSLRIDAQFQELIEREENRPISDYAFLNIAGDEESAFLQRSPLSQFPVATEIPGLLGYFQVDSAGQLQTPTVPRENASVYGISANELKQRVEQEKQVTRYSWPETGLWKGSRRAPSLRHRQWQVNRRPLYRRLHLRLKKNWSKRFRALLTKTMHKVCLCSIA